MDATEIFFSTGGNSSRSIAYGDNAVWVSTLRGKNRPGHQPMLATGARSFSGPYGWIINRSV
jgi:hypothetical protein